MSKTRYLKALIKANAAATRIHRDEVRKIEQWYSRLYREVHQIEDVQARRLAYHEKLTGFYSRSDHFYFVWERTRLKEEARAMHLAYGLMRGVPYEALEPRSYTEPQWHKVLQVVEKQYGSHVAARLGPAVEQAKQSWKMKNQKNVIQAIEVMA